MNHIAGLIILPIDITQKQDVTKLMLLTLKLSILTFKHAKLLTREAHLTLSRSV